VAEGQPRANLGFFPLTMDYREKMYAGGLIPGGFFKREGAPNQKEILTMRLMDRPIRPLFPDGYIWEVQVQAYVISSDKENDADICAINAASASLTLSSLPWNGPIGAVRIGRVDDEFVVNPTASQREESDLDLVVTGTQAAVTMVEASANEQTEDVIVAALELAHSEIKKICAALEELRAVAGREKDSFEPQVEDPQLLEVIRQETSELWREAHTRPGTKREKKDHLSDAMKSCIERFAPADDEGDVDQDRAALVKRYATDVSREVFRAVTLSGTRVDGREPAQIRALTSEVSVLPRAHGSALFRRGETQSLVTTTLGTKFAEQLIEGLHETYYRKFNLHYNFPNFCVGEPKFIRGPSRREVGHGKLAERALACVLPDHDDFPYTIRIVSAARRPWRPCAAAPCR
jgi:polyribonucleotide nucleotidyltransferase